MLAVALLLFVAVTLIRFSTKSVGDGYSLLYVLPVALAALQFGVIGGLLAAVLAMWLTTIWAQIGDVGLSAAGYLTRATTFLLLGGLVGFEVQQQRRLQAERERLLAHVQEIARTDELTGLANRRAWDEGLRRELERARRSGTGLSVGLLDLDHFKQYNDRYGHQAGDDLLKAAAAEWCTHVRVGDTVARYGGEEFALLLPESAPDDARAVIERVRGTTPMGQTASAGIAHWDGAERVESLIARADGALYEAKRAGRDCSVVAAAPA